jgi:TIR domain
MSWQKQTHAAPIAAFTVDGSNGSSSTCFAVDEHPMSGKIFINYRRDDDPGFTQALFGRLEQAFPPEQLFMDVDNIRPGTNFVRLLDEQIAECDVIVVVIGKNWIDARDEANVRRLDNPADFVRGEIEAGLKQGKCVIPVLVHDARMPRPEDLPEAIRSLTNYNAVRLTHERFRADVQGLIKALQQTLDEVEALRQTQAEALRQAKLEEERKREEEAEKARVQARREWEDLVWVGLGPAPGLDELSDFVAEFPQGTHAKAAADRRAALKREQAATEESRERERRETEAWASVSRVGGVAALETFLKEWPQSQHADAARARILQLRRRGVLLGLGGTAGLALVAGVVVWRSESQLPSSEPSSPTFEPSRPPATRPFNPHLHGALDHRQFGRVRA